MLTKCGKKFLDLSNFLEKQENYKNQKETSRELALEKMTSD